MTTYRLPEALGGREAELIEWSATGYPSFASLQVDDVVVIVPQEHITVLVPPEPAVGTCVLVDTASGPNGLVFRRYALGWTEPGRDADAPGFSYYDWAQVCSYGTPVALAPDPFAETAVLPPWESGSGQRILEVRLDDDQDSVPSIYVQVSDADQGVLDFWLTADEARAFARMVWAAADTAEAKS